MCWNNLLCIQPYQFNKILLLVVKPLGKKKKRKETAKICFCRVLIELESEWKSCSVTKYNLHVTWYNFQLVIIPELHRCACVCTQVRPTLNHTKPTRVLARSGSAGGGLGGYVYRHKIAKTGKFPFYQKQRFYQCIESYRTARYLRCSYFRQRAWYFISICNVFVLWDWCSLPGWFFIPISCLFHLLCSWIIWFHGSCKFRLYPRKVGNWHYHLIVSQPLCS